MKTKIIVAAMLAIFAFTGCKNEENATEKQKLSDKQVTLKIGDTKELKVTPDSQTLVWSSDDPTIASVRPNSGIITAHKVGTTTIRVEDPATKFEDKCEVTVEAAATGQQLVTKTLNIKVGATSQIEVSPNSEGITWLSDETTIASVNATGVVTGNKVGAATITVKNSSTDFEDDCKVTVEGNFNTFDPVITEWGMTKEALKSKETRTFMSENSQPGQDYLVFEGENEFVGGDVWYAFDKETALLIRVEMYATFTNDDNIDEEWQQMLDFWGERLIEESITDEECAYSSIDGKTFMIADKSMWDYMGEIPVVYQPVE